MVKNNLLSIDAIRCILGLDKNLIIDHQEMAKNLKVTFYPYEGKVSNHTRLFYIKLKEAFQYYGVTIIPYDQALVDKKHKLIKKGLCLIALGEQDDDHMPIDCLSSYRENFILTIMDDIGFVPKGLHTLSFMEQADYGYNAIAWHFSNYIIGVSEKYWVHFSGNGMFDVNEIDYEGDFKHTILKSVISKLYAPLLPIPMSEFVIIEPGFDPYSPEMKPYINDVIEGGKIFSKTRLLDYRIRFDAMHFRKDAYKKTIQIMFDNRTGAHLGYLSRQLPATLSEVLSMDEARQKLGIQFDDIDYVVHDGDIYLKFTLPKNELCLKLPEVATITSISGAKKNDLTVDDIVKMVLKNGKMYLQFPKTATIDYDTIRPSFDTKVILSNALSSTIYASIMRYYNQKLQYPTMLQTNGMGILCPALFHEDGSSMVRTILYVCVQPIKRLYMVLWVKSAQCSALFFPLSTNSWVIFTLNRSMDSI